MAEETEDKKPAAKKAAAAKAPAAKPTTAKASAAKAPAAKAAKISEAPQALKVAKPWETEEFPHLSIAYRRQ